jgi:hypothetical protein
MIFSSPLTSTTAPPVTPISLASSATDSSASNLRRGSLSQLTLAVPAIYVTSLTLTSAAMHSSVHTGVSYLHAPRPLGDGPRQCGHTVTPQSYVPPCPS